MTDLIPPNWRETLPQWWREAIQCPEKYFLILSDDDDSYKSCALLYDLSKRKLRVEGYIYFEEGLYLTDAAKSDWKSGSRKPIFVDCSCVYGHCPTFNNHIIPYNLENNNEINFNNIVKNQRYIQKYAGSTYLMLLWLYDVDLQQFSENELVEILTTDSFQRAYYTDFKGIHDLWMQSIGVKDMFLPILSATPEEDLKKFRMNTKYKIYIDENGHLYSTKDVNLPRKRRFKQVLQLKEYQLSMEDFANLTQQELKGVFTASRTFSNVVRYSVIAE